MMNDFKTLFKNRFSAKSINTHVFNFDQELSELKQLSSEDIKYFYERIAALMQRVGVRDLPIEEIVPILESAAHERIMKAFVKGVLDIDIGENVIKGSTHNNVTRSLHSLSFFTENTIRSKKEIEELQEKEKHSKELEFYKENVKKNMPSERIKALKTEYQTNPTFS